MKSYRPFKNDSLDDIKLMVDEQALELSTLRFIKDELQIRTTSAAKHLLNDVNKALLKLDSAAPELNKMKIEHKIEGPLSDQAKAAQIKIAELRRRLLDLSNRNKLINFKHTSRGGRQIRIAGEWIPDLYEVLHNDKEVELMPLPKLPTEPEDEKTPEFKMALEKALLTDRSYAEAIQKSEDEPEEKAELLIVKAERALRDRLRKMLGWTTRSEILAVTGAEHAKRMGIDPTYDLKNSPSSRKKRKPHQWQTLLDPDELDRRLRALDQQARESSEEYGVETLYLIIGFLEWNEKTSDGIADESRISPLLLQPINIQKRTIERKSRAAGKIKLIEDGDATSEKHGELYKIRNGSDDISVNLCLNERLKQDFGLELPEWDDESTIETFLNDVKKIIAVHENWKVRHYATVTHLSFNRLAMWMDLDPDKSSVTPPHFHPILSELFGGSEIISSDDSKADEKNVFEDCESGVPSLIMDCDSSQFAAIKEALSGRNLTIQGPPGTGKSQTIANIIASFLYEGKTVLFVAEKMAALNVVHDRLSNAGIGDFLLELHSAKASKRVVLDSIKSRIHRAKMLDKRSGDIKDRRKSLRDKLNLYALAINSNFGLSGLTLHTIMWRHFEYKDAKLPDSLIGYCIPEVEIWDKDAIDLRTEALEQIVELNKIYSEEKKEYDHPWNWVDNPNLHVRECDQINSHVLELFSKLDDLQKWIVDVKLISDPFSYSTLKNLAQKISGLGNRPVEIKKGLWDLALQSDILDHAAIVISANSQRVDAELKIQEIIPAYLTKTNSANTVLENLNKISGLLIRANINGDTDSKRLEQLKLKNAEVLVKIDAVRNLIFELRETLNTNARVSESELAAIEMYLKLAANAPNAIISKRHLLGADGNTNFVRKKIAEMEACEARIKDISLQLSVDFESLNFNTILKCSTELINSGPFSFFRKKYREAIAYCRNVLPNIDKKDRLHFIDRLRVIIDLKNRLHNDRQMRDAAGDLFLGWDTNKKELIACCDWIDSVFSQTATLNKYSEEFPTLF